MLSRLFGRRRRTEPAPLATAASSPAAFRPPAPIRLEEPLLRLSPQDVWTLRDAREGTVIFGATGSGKTSGSGYAIAHAMLRAGFGGLVLCAKPGERQLWERYCAETGRSESVIVFDGSGRRKFNFLEYELARSQATGTFEPVNLVQLFMRLSEAANTDQGGAKTAAENDFWTKSVHMLLKYAIYALNAAYGRVRLSDVVEMAHTAPKSEAELANLEWQKNSFCFRTLHKLYREPVHPLPVADREQVMGYWRRAFANADQRTPGNIMATLATIIDPFLTGTMRELFCTDTNVVPEMTHAGAILIVDLPIKTYFGAGTLAQHVFKYLWQRAAEARARPDERPIFLWADECQFFINAYDAEFQSTARSACACTVYLTQNLPGLYHYIGGPRPEHTVDSLLGNFQTKIFHANSDFKTNQWAADMIGKNLQLRRNGSIGDSDAESEGTSYGENTGWSESDGVTLGTSFSENSSQSRTNARTRGTGTSNGRNRSWGGSNTGGFMGFFGGTFSSNWSSGRNAGTSTNESTNRSLGSTFGRVFGRSRSESTTHSRSGGQSRGHTTSRSRTTSRTQGFSEVMDYEIQPHEFARLRSGGAPNREQVDAIVVKGARVWRHSKSVWLPCVFSQS